MFESVSNKAIQTKIKAMYGRRLTQNNFVEMLHMQSVSEIAGYLKNETYYKDALANVQESMIHRGQLENMLGHNLFNDVNRLKKYAKGRDTLFESYLMNIEVQQIISCIGYLSSGERDDFLVHVPGYLLGQLTIDLNRMIYAQSDIELVAALEKTRYQAVVYKLMHENGGKLPEVSLCAAALKRLYFGTLLTMIEKQYKGRERDDLRKIVLLQVETVNLATAFRLKKFFGEPDTEISKHMIPYYNGIREAAFDKILKSDTPDEFIRNTLATRTGKHMEAEDFDFIEYSTMERCAENSKQMLTFTTSPAVCFMAYISLRLLELTNTINVVEGVRYQVSPEEIQKLLIIV